MINQLLIIISGFIAGITVATTGAYKDTKHEAFKKRTFIRSPLVASLWSLIFYWLPINPVEWFFIAIGLERLITELWKCYRARKGTYMPGKFNHGEW